MMGRWADTWVHPAIVNEIIVGKIVGYELLGEGISIWWDYLDEDRENRDEEGVMGVYYDHYSLLFS